MTITCPFCGFSADVPPGSIPPKATEATCPRCKAAFPLERMTSPPAAETTESQPAVAETTCPACGHRQPGGNRCGQCGAALAPTATAGTAAYAGFWIRLAAAWVDSIVLTVLYGILTVALLILSGLITAGQGGEAAAVGILGAILLLPLFLCAIGMAYFVVFTGVCGQTPGKMLMRIKVVQIDGSAMTYGCAALRELLGKFVCGITLGAGYLMAAFDERKQGLHDKIAGTCVIHL